MYFITLQCWCIHQGNSFNSHPRRPAKGRRKKQKHCIINKSNHNQQTNKKETTTRTKHKLCVREQTCGWLSVIINDNI